MDGNKGDFHQKRNSVIDCLGKGLRNGVNLEAFRALLRIFNKLSHKLSMLCPAPPK